ncbi:MAG: hypothetical protein U0326_03075 [Polyangiales bacterium]
MKRQRWAIGAAALCGALGAGCMDQQQTSMVQVATTSGGEGVASASSGQYLYLPASNMPASAVQSVVVQSSDGRQFNAGSGQVYAAAGGRIAVALPQGMTDGTATLNVNGQVISVPFHVVVSMSSAPVIGTMQVATSDPRCAAIAGTWQGSIWSTAGSTATAYFQILDDCRTVQGIISAAAPSSGSVDATIEGTWDASSGTLVARDTQLFNVQPRNGTSFCETTRYELRLTPDGELVGTNDTSDTSCGNVAPVRLYHVR